jgi:hypothetical protein
MPIVFYYMSLNHFIYITRWRLNKLRKTTLPTHLYRKTYQLIPLLTPVNSGETLPLKLKYYYPGQRVRCAGGTECWLLSFFSVHQHSVLLTPTRVRRLPNKNSNPRILESRDLKGQSHRYWIIFLGP